MIEAVIFDFDGTLFDTTRAICTAFNGAMKADGRRPLPYAVITAMIGRPLVEMFARADPEADAATIERRVAAYRRLFLPVCVRASRPLPGMLECLRALRRRRCRLAIATNRKADGAVRILRGHGVRRYFSALVGIDEVSHYKPDPEGIFVALRRLNTPTERAAMVGDTPDDMAAGRAAGVLTIGVTTGGHSARALRRAGADDVLPSLAQLPARLSAPP